MQPREHAARLGRIERRVVDGGPHAGRQQGVDLVLHERDERRHDDADAGPHEGRDLVAERLAAAGRHEYERVAAGDQVVDDLLLVGPELAKAEDAVQYGGRRRAGGWRGGGGRCGCRRGGCGRRLSRLGVGRHGASVAHRPERTGRSRRPPLRCHPGSAFGTGAHAQWRLARCLSPGGRKVVEDL